MDYIRNIPLIFLTLLMIMCSHNIYAATVHVTYPTGATDSNTSAVESYLNGYFSKIGGLNNLARGFANTNASVHQSATPFGFQNYDLFSVIIGTQFGLTPADSIKSAYHDMKDISSEGDMYAGMSTGGIVANVGLNASFLMNRLYLGCKIGGIEQNISTTSVSIRYNQFIIGLSANYRLIDESAIVYDSVKWRGLSVGTGITYVSSTADADIYNIPNTTINGVITINKTSVKLGIKSSAIVFPFEASTSFQIFQYLNLGLGAGLDIIVPKSTINVNAGSNIYSISQGQCIMTLDSIDTTSKPKLTDIVAPRVNGSIGFSIVAIRIEFPVSYYPLTKIMTLGISTGMVW
jgi:hypothetical protein